MRKIILTLLLVCSIISTTFASITKTVNVPTAGTMGSISSISNAKLTVTNLIVTGNIDARDIKYMRDEMPALLSIDISNAFIKGYTGSDGTVNASTVYSDNVMPAQSFNTGFNTGKAITTINLPLSLTAIGTSAFDGCNLLTGITIPSYVSSIQSGAFVSCTNLSSVICKSTTPPTLEANVFSLDNLAQKFPATLFIPVGGTTAYASAQADWQNFFKSFEYILTTSTQAASAITPTSALLKGSMDVMIDSPVSANGFCWNTSGSPTLLDNKIDNGSKTILGAISNTISGLAQNTNYYARAFATDGNGTVYGNEITFTTAALPAAAGVIAGSTSVCQGQVTVTYTVPVIPFATTYTWSLPTGVTGSSTSNSITVNIATSFTSGTISVKGHNSWGDGEISSLLINANLLPESAGSIVGNTSICLGGNTETYTIPAIANASSYIWTLPSGATGSSVTNSIQVVYSKNAVSGNITVKGHNDCGDGAISTLPIAANKVPLVELINTTTKSGVPFQLNPSVSYTGLDPLTYHWSPGLGLNDSTILNPSATLTKATTYTLTVTSSKGCSASAQMTVSLSPADAEAIVGNSSICPNSLTETYTVPAISGATTYVWTLPTGAKASTSPLSTTNSITVTYSKTTFIGGNITVKGNNSVGFGTVSTLPVTMSVLPTLTMSNKSVKAGSPLLLEPAVTYLGTGNLSYRWSPSTGLSDSTSMNPTATLNQGIIYTLTVSTSNGCSVSGQMTVSILPDNAEMIQGNTSVCPDLSSVTYTVPSIKNATSYTWTLPVGFKSSTTPLSTTNSITVSILKTALSGNITVKGKNSVGDGEISTLPINVNSIPTVSLTNMNVKAGSSVQITPTVSYSGSGTLTYRWSPSKGLNDSTIVNPIASINQEVSTYTLTVTTPNGCSTVNQTTINILPADAGAIIGNQSVCQGSTETYTVPIISGATSYSWSFKGVITVTTTNSITLDILSTTTSGNLTVKGVNGVGNGVSTTFPILVNKMPVINMTNKTVKSGGSIQLSPAVNYTGTGTLSYRWSPGKSLSDSTILNPTAIVTTATTYTLTVNVSNGCSTTAEMTVGIATMSKPEFGFVGVFNNKNTLVWNKEASIGIDSYIIYRESSVINQYEKIGTVSYDSLSVFVDTQSAPNVKSSKYQISMLDKSGLESAKSGIAKNMFLTINKGNGTAPSISWEAYTGFAIANYNVYRGTTPNSMTLLGTTDLNTTNYYDATAPSGTIYYQVEVISPSLIIPTKLIKGLSQSVVLQGIDNYSASRSNVVSVTNTLSGLNESNFVNFDVYPNPCNGILTINLEKAYSFNYSVSISNTLGQKLYNEKIVSDKTSLDVSQFGNKGIYIVQILDEKGNNMGRKKVIVQ